MSCSLSGCEFCTKWKFKCSNYWGDEWIRSCTKIALSGSFLHQLIVFHVTWQDKEYGCDYFFFIHSSYTFSILSSCPQEEKNGVNTFSSSMPTHPRANNLEVKPESSKLPVVSVASATAPASTRVVLPSESMVLFYRSFHCDNLTHGGEHHVG